MRNSITVTFTNNQKKQYEKCVEIIKVNEDKIELVINMEGIQEARKFTYDLIEAYYLLQNKPVPSKTIINCAMDSY